MLAERRNDVLSCAERKLMRDAPPPDEECVLVVFRVYFSKAGKVSIKHSTPCAKCARALRSAAPERVIAAAWTAKGGGVEVCPPVCVPIVEYEAKNGGELMF